MSLSLGVRKIITRLVNYGVKVYIDSTDQSEIQVMALHPDLSVTVDTELPAAALLADGSPIPTAPQVGAVMQGVNASGTVDNAKLAKAHDVDSGAGTEYATGISLRKPGNGGSTDWMDDIATSLTTINSSITTLGGYVDGLEALATSLNGYVDNVEGYTDGLEGLITTLNGYVDGLEGYTDGLESQIGATNETAPANDTASSGLNGRLQRVAQRISSLIALIPAALTGSGNFKVAIQEAIPAGTNAIGKLAANSGVDIGDVDVTSLPALAAGTNLIGRVSASGETSTIYNGTTALTPKFAKIDTATSADIIAAVTSKKLRVIAGFLLVASDTTVKFQSNASTNLTGAMTIKSGGGFVLPYNPAGYFETVAGEKLNMVLGTGVQTSGSLTYVEV